MEKEEEIEEQNEEINFSSIEEKCEYYKKNLSLRNKFSYSNIKPENKIDTNINKNKIGSLSIRRFYDKNNKDNIKESKEEDKKTIKCKIKIK